MKTYTYDDYFGLWDGSEEAIEYTFESPIDLDESVFQKFIWSPFGNEIRAVIYCGGNANKLFHRWLESQGLISEYTEEELEEADDFCKFMSEYEYEEDN